MRLPSSKKSLDCSHILLESSLHHICALLARLGRAEQRTHGSMEFQELWETVLELNYSSRKHRTPSPTHLPTHAPSHSHSPHRVKWRQRPLRKARAEAGSEHAGFIAEHAGLATAAPARGRAAGAISPLEVGRDVRGLRLEPQLLAELLDLAEAGRLPRHPLLHAQRPRVDPVCDLRPRAHVRRVHARASRRDGSERRAGSGRVQRRNRCRGGSRPGRRAASSHPRRTPATCPPARPPAKNAQALLQHAERSERKTCASL